MRLWRSVLFIAIWLMAALPSQAQEEIRNFRVSITVEQDGDLQITEEITVNAEGKNIRRGIFRDLPRYYQDAETTGRLPYQYDVISVERNNRSEPYSQESEGNAWRLRIGDADVLLPLGEHTYRIRYMVKNKIRYFDTYDELFWNITGNYWAFPIRRAEAIVTLPAQAQIIEANAYTGGYGAARNDYTYRRVIDAHVFETTQQLSSREGLTVSLALEKGVIDPPSLGDKGWLWWARNGALSVLLGSFIGVLIFYYRSFDRVGRDPVKGPVFPQYEPPAGYSPAAAHHIYYRGLRGHGALIASLMQLGVNGHVKIAVEKKFLGKDKTSLSLIEQVESTSDLPRDTRRLVADLFGMRANIELDGSPNPTFITNYNGFRKRLSDQYGSAYFKRNFGYVAIGGVLTLAAIVYAANQVSLWTVWHTAIVVSLIGLNGLFMYLMPAPTHKGQKIRTHIEGLRLYMEKAEALQLNAVDVASEAPPPMTKARYEAFLPYAIALGVEKPWSKHFENLIPEEAARYNPGWSNLGRGGFGTIGGMTDGIVSGISSGVASAAPQSSGSSGMGGGGFSGGGGGGGGGGGW